MLGGSNYTYCSKRHDQTKVIYAWSRFGADLAKTLVNLRRPFTPVARFAIDGIPSNSKLKNRS
jgi:hypothetical protein